MNFPGVLVTAPSLTDKDKADVKFANAQEVEYLALSFVRRAVDVEELRKLQLAGYNPVEIAHRSEIREIFHFIEILHGDFREFIDALTYQGDAYYHLADFDSYWKMQQQIMADYHDQAAWVGKGIANTACAGKFSSDRTVQQYARDTWRICE